MGDSEQLSSSRSSVGPATPSYVGKSTGRLTRLLGRSRPAIVVGRFFRRQLWAWPIMAAVLLCGAGFWVNHSLEKALRQQRINEVTTILEADLAALELWMTQQQQTAELYGQDETLVSSARELLSLANKPDASRELLGSAAQASLRQRLSERLRASGYTGFRLVSPEGVMLAADQDAPVGVALDGYRKEFFAAVSAGKANVSRPVRSPYLLPDKDGNMAVGLPVMFAAAPLRDEEGRVIAALGLCIRPEDQFTRILQVARSGKTGETYAFDRNGLLLSQSRFDEDLKQVGLLVDRPDSHSILTIEIRDPVVNMMAGGRPTARRSDQALTRMAADAVQGRSGVDADGYNDYRGVPVVGAWRWLDEHDFGVTTEIDVAEAFAPVYIVRRAFAILIGLLVVFAIVIFGAMLLIARQHRAIQRAALAARQLGQYRLGEKLGAGGMASVYKASHSMLRRPTAIKLLDLDKLNTSGIARFEREVQLTSALTHPNTVAVFDYGRTPEGLFYYAMEYLEGINLDELVARFGALSEARAIHILRQICGSLAEAHATGLVHRDVKPANIVLTVRGGVHDFVKVLDFGLAKAFDGRDQPNLTTLHSVTGTPLYLAPEAIQQPDQVDARADVYALGALAYFLLTATPVFTGSKVMEICSKHLYAVPEPPSKRLGRPISESLERLILRCLSKAPAERPADAQMFLYELEACKFTGSWTAYEASTWWVKNASLFATEESILHSQAPVRDPNLTASLPKELTQVPAKTLISSNGQS